MKLHIAPAKREYGHWWIELNGTESYGWWPDRQLDGLWDTVRGVGGILNGYGVFRGGTPTLDPHHGDIADETFNPTTQGEKDCKTGKDNCKKKCKEVEDCFRNFAGSFKGNWSWPLGPNCRTFQKEGMKRCGLKKP